MPADSKEAEISTVLKAVSTRLRQKIPHSQQYARLQACCPRNARPQYPMSEALASLKKAEQVLKEA